MKQLEPPDDPMRILKLRFAHALVTASNLEPPDDPMRILKRLNITLPDQDVFT